jgi:hypothetical protein
MNPIPLPPVDLVINCYERTYRDVLAPGFFHGVASDCEFNFSQRTVLLNNIAEMDSALRLAKERISAGEIDQVFLVNRYLEEALQVTGLTRRGLGRIPHYSNWALVALVVPGSDYMVHWDAEIRMVHPFNWIEPSLQLMQADSRIAVANPLWKTGGAAPEFRERVGDFSLSYGFSDQVYLLSRKDFARPIYHHWVPIALRYPVAHIAPYFEQMVDSYLRVANRYRATLVTAQYVHPVAEGAEYPRDILARASFAVKRATVAIMRHSPGRHRYFHD